MADKNFSTYSLMDVRVTMSHPKKGKKVLSGCGGGRIVISYTGDVSSHTSTATGYVVVNRLRSKNGTVTLELPQNSPADLWVRALIKYLSNDNTNTENFATGRLELYDPIPKRTITCSGLTPQRLPDENYDQASTTRNYVFLAAEIGDN